MTGSRWTLAAGAIAVTAACGRGEPAAGGADTTAAPPAAASLPTRVEGFQTPESAKYDAELDVWYVTNINGSPVDKDGNGYISRLQGDGTMDSLKFIAGGVNGAVLNGPKGMALQGDTLWVADIDAVRAFNRRTGAPVTSIALHGAKFLNDLAVGPDGLYITDTGVEMGPSGLNHTGPDRIYRVGPDGRQSVALQGDSLGGPNGITWDAARGRFIVVPFIGTVVRAWTPGSKVTLALGATKGQVDGVEVLDSTRLLLTSWADSSLDVLEHGTLTRLANDLPSPADIGVDTRRNRVAIPIFMENRVEFRPLPAAGQAVP